MYRLRVFFVMTFLQMVFELNIWSGLAGQGHWFLETHRYDSQEQLIVDLGEWVIRPAEAKVLELRGAKPETNDLVV